MLSGTRDHEASLLDAERFYYSNYEYYNTYEEAEGYQHDLSKIRFNLRRKSRAAIVLYDTHSSNYGEEPTERLLRECHPKVTHHCAHIHDRHGTLDDLLFRFATAFHENNYADLRSDREDAKDNFDLIVLKYMHSFFFEGRPAEDQQQAFQQLIQVLEGLREQGERVRGRLEALYEREGRAQSTELLERWFAFEQYWHFLLAEKLIADSKYDKIENFYLFEFSQYFRHFLQQVTAGSIRTVLLLAQPETPALSQLVHPLTIPLAAALKGRPHPPRILFLNLDGRETYLNLRVVSALPDTVRYISIFRQPSGTALAQTTLQKGCAEFETEADFVNMNSTHSQLLWREVLDDGGVGEKKGGARENTLLYPLNSLYLRHKYSQARKDRPLNERRLPAIQDCDLRWLWEEVVSKQAEEWSPDLTIISYNGALDIPEEDFAEILRDLTALSDHRVMLFSNMTGLFRPPPDEAMEEENEAYPRDKVELVREFLSQYVPYRYEEVDEERLFCNLSQFVKIASGSISLKKRPQHRPHGRYALGTRLLYLERLAELPEYAQVLLGGGQAGNVDRLFREFARREIEQNRKQNEWWSRKIDEAEGRLLSLDPEAELEREDGEEEGGEEIGRARREVACRVRSIRHELEAEELMVHGEMDTQAEFEQYLRRQKERLLLDNLETYHYRRVYTGEEDERGGRLRSYRFCMQDGDGQELLLERYSQVITDDKKTRIFIVNYRLADDKHVILHGDITERGGHVKMKRAAFKLEAEFEDFVLGSEKLNVNYSHCFAKDKLYLFWSQRWDIEQEITRRLLGLDYRPPHLNDMLRLTYSVQDKAYIVERINWVPSQGIPPVPRRGCVGLDIASSDTRFYILGGIYDSRLDFYSGTAGVNLAVVTEDSFTIHAAAKRKDRQSSRNSFLKPKMNYRVEKGSRTSEEGGSILLSGGYGRAFTNFHSLFSLEGYSVANELDGLKITRIQSKNPRVTRLSQPMSVAAVGRFLVGAGGEGEERFSEAVKDWMVGEGRDERSSEREVLTVLEEEMRVREFKSDHKRNYLFGWDRTIRERIYVPHCWSPELQIIVAGRLYLVYTALKADKSSSYNMGNFLIPKEEDLASVHLDEDRLLLLSNSPVLHSLENKPNNYILYEGSLANINDLVTRRELPMHERYEFRGPSRAQNSLKYKTIFTIDDRIFLLGGLGKEQHEREDYLLERHKDKLKGKARRLECADDSLELTSPVVVKHKDGFLLYSVLLEQRTLPKGDGAHCIEDFWRLKIETFTPNDSCQEETLHSGPLLLYHLDFDAARPVSRRPQFEDPKIVKVLPYCRFSWGALREVMEKVLVKINRLEEERFQPFLEVLKQFVRAREEQRLAALLYEHHHRGATFKSLLAMFDPLLDDERRERDNLESEELVRDLRGMSSLMNKHLIESVLQPEGEGGLHRFVMEDRSSRKVKYVAIGPLLTTRLRFLRIRYKHELSICLNETNEEELFFNTSVLACEEIAREKLKGTAVEWEEEPTTHKITVSYRT